MANYYIYKIDSAIDTFSQFEAGVNFKFETTTLNSNFQFKQNDLIIGFRSPSSIYILLVDEYNSNELSLTKQIEIDSDIQIEIEDDKVIKKIDEIEYESLLSKVLAKFTKEDHTTNSGTVINPAEGDLKNNFADWLFLQGRYKRVYNSDKAILIEKLSEYGKAYEHDFGIEIFDGTKLSIETIITELESNVINESGQVGDLNKRTVGNGSVKAILGPNNYIKFLQLIKGKLNTASKNSPLRDPINKIYFGAPGTGKSYHIVRDLDAVDTIFKRRVTFHPDYDNASFVGSYKPFSSSVGEIRYDFVPQIFTNIYVDACNDPAHQYYLIIEEINRGNCAEIFGDLFQLLDRNPEYEIEPSMELTQYLTENISMEKFFKDGKMLLPTNLSILATMNTSDQSLFPMDSAFKRRWDWEYIPINYEKENNPSAEFYVKLKDDSNFNWIDFIKKVNYKYIKSNPNLGMDKCIGNYFIQPKNKEISLEEFINKAIFYLWNDVFKDEEDNIFEENTFYEDFFPIETNGNKKVITMLEKLELIPSPKND